MQLFDLKNINLANLLTKLPGVSKRIDTKVQQARQEGEARGRNQALTSVGDFLFPPVLGGAQSMFDPEAMRPYDAARMSARMYVGDPRVAAAINKIARKATQANENGRPFELDVQIDFELQRDD